jgi:hypothetical protein
MDKPIDADEVRAVYQTMVTGVHRMRADKLSALSSEDRDLMIRQSTIAELKRRGVTISEEELIPLIK